MYSSSRYSGCTDEERIYLLVSLLEKTLIWMGSWTNENYQTNEEYMDWISQTSSG